MTSSSTHRHHHVDAEQPRVVALVERAVVGGLRQQEHQHEADGRDHRGAHADGPAHGARARAARAASRGAAARLGAHFAASPAAAGAASRRRCSSRTGRPRRSGRAAAAARCRAGSGSRPGAAASSPISASVAERAAGRRAARASSASASGVEVLVQRDAEAGVGDGHGRHVEAPAARERLVGQAHVARRLGDLAVGPVPAFAVELGLGHEVDRRCPCRAPPRPAAAVRTARRP